MKYLIIDLSKFRDIKKLHEYIAKGLDFPDYYGKNLDALYDCLTDIDEPTALVVMNVPENSDALQGRLEGLLSVFENAADENPKISLKRI